MEKKISLIRETPARRVPVEFDYEHSAPLVGGGRVIAGDRARELSMVRDAADGVIAAIKGSRDNLCSSTSGVLLCTRHVGHDGPHVCASVTVVAHDIWVDDCDVGSK